jgi:glycosyltransferase involved in cell wall biosynthesis
VRILYAHNFYRIPGGEDETFADEIRLMRERGYDVDTFETSSKTLNGQSRLKAGIAGVWSARAARAIRARIAAERPDIVHFHNVYPVMSPAVFRAAAAEGVAVVHTLHNYRLLCSNGGLYHRGGVCEACIGAVAPWHGVLRGCNDHGRAADAQIAVAVAFHRAAGTWARSIDRYIALTTFARDNLVRGGLPATRIAVLPTFVDPDPGIGPGDGGYALFIGRLTVEKGVRILLDAWRKCGTRLPLKIVGSGGPLAEEVAAAASTIPGVALMGRVLGESRWPEENNRKVLTDLTRRASFLVFPSLWYEGTPRTIAEAFAAGTPVIASDVGAMRSMVQPGANGQWFKAGDAIDLARVASTLANDPLGCAELRLGARRTFEAHYSAARHFEGLATIYQAAIAQRRGVHAASIMAEAQ